MLRQLTFKAQSSPPRRQAREGLGVLGVLAVVLALFSVTAWSQTATATLFVHARDQSGGLLPGVAVELVQETTGIRRTGVTSVYGSLVMPLLPPGRCTLTASLAGFKSEVIRDIRLEAGVKATLDLLLLPGSPDEKVVVSADISTLRPGNSTIGEVFDNRTLITMPLNGREFLQLSLLAPGAAPPAPGSRLSTQANSGVNISGAREAANNFLLDGVDNNDLFLNRFVFNPNPDAIQEFTVLANNYDAEYGRNAGAQVNVVLKSGGSDVHGSAYEYFRHSAMDARNFFDLPDQPIPLLRQNQFGGTLGGPFSARSGQPRHFYFLSVEGSRAKRAETRSSNVPTAAQKSGDFSQTGVRLRDPSTGIPFPDNRIPPSQIHAVSKAIVSLYPHPNRQVAGRNFVSSPIGTTDSTQLAVKLDHYFSEENPIFVRYTISDDFRTFPFAERGPNLPGYGISVLDRGQNLALGSTQSISQRSINDLRFGYNRLRREAFNQNKGRDAFRQLGMAGPSLGPNDMGFPSFAISGYESLGDDPNIPVVRRTGTFHLSDSLHMERGKHHLKLGAEIRSYLSNGFNHVFARGQIIFAPRFTGDALADLLLGLPTLSIVARNDNDQALRTRSYNFFVQDDWKASPHLTVNAGLRCEYNTPPIDAHNRMVVFEINQKKLLPVATGGVSRSGLRPDRNNFSPRLGLSWDISKKGTLVLRTGYGVFYDVGTLIGNSALYFNPPYFLLGTLFNFQLGADKFLFRVKDPFATTLTAFLPTAVSLDPHFRTAYSQHWSLGLEGAVGKDTTVEARYVGSKGTKLVMKRNLNQPPPGPGFLNARRPVAGFSDILWIESGAASNYHSLQVRVEKKHSTNLSFLGSYTFSKSIDNTSAFLESKGNDNTPQNSSDIRSERALSDFDLRHRVSVALTYDLPFHFDNPLLREWQLSGILAIQSGRPFTPRLSFDNSNTGNVGGFFGHDRPNLAGDPTLTHPTPDRFFNTAPFSIPPRFSFGNAGRNIVSGPGFASLDLALMKDFLLSGERRLQLRAELYNAFNHPNFQLPESFVDRLTFGRVLSAFPSRQLQLALRFSW